jgi:hypothetical protein
MHKIQSEQKELTSLFKRIAVFAVLMLIITLSIGAVSTTVGPIASDEIALEQMKDTVSGHAAMRAYTKTTNNLETYAMPTIGLVLALILFVGPIKRIYAIKTETKE